MDIDMSNLSYPEDAAQVRDLVKEMLSSQVDEGTAMDRGGGSGTADLWVTFGGQEFLISVKSCRAG